MSNATTLVGETTSGRANRACALSGTTSIADTSGHTTGSAGRERVGGRARGRRAHHSVAAPSAQRAAVDLDHDVDHALARALLERDLVERPRGVDDLPRLEQPDVQGHAVLGGPPAVHDRVDDGRQVLRLGLGEEAHVAEVDAEQRHPARPGPLCRPQHGSVATEHDDDVGAVGRVLVGRHRHDARIEAGVAVGRQVIAVLLGEDDLDVGRREPAHHGGRGRTAPRRCAGSPRAGRVASLPRRSLRSLRHGPGDRPLQRLARRAGRRRPPSCRLHGSARGSTRRYRSGRAAGSRRRRGRRAPARSPHRPRPAPPIAGGLDRARRRRPRPPAPPRTAA